MTRRAEYEPVLDLDFDEGRPDWICAHCDDQGEYSSEFTWKLKEGWPENQQTLVCDYCGTDRQYIVRRSETG